MPFKYLICRIIFWGGGLILVTQLLSQYFFLERDQMLEAKLTDFYEQASQIEIITLGTSHNMAFYFTNLGHTGMSFYDGGADIYNAKYKLDAILTHTTALKAVIIPISPGYLGLKYDLNWWSVRHRNMMFNLPTPKLNSLPDLITTLSKQRAYWVDIQHINQFIKQNLYQEIKALLDLLSNTSRAKLDPVPQSSKVEHEFGILGGYKATTAPSATLARLAEETVLRHEKFVRDTLSIDPNAWQSNTKILLEMADSLKARRAKLILVVPPYTKEYYQHPLMQELLNEQQAFLEVLQEHEAIYYLDFHDYFYNSGYQKHNTIFHDDHHLALEGAKIFSSHLKPYINDILSNPHQ